MIDEARTAQEEERDFLLRSLDDLESERAAGNIDDETYQRLHDDYTARAAITVRAMQEGKETGAAPGDLPPTSRRHRVLVVGGIVVFAAIAATTMAFALGARLPGDTITGRSRGGTAVASPKERLAALEAEATKNPTNAEDRLSVARFELGQQDLTGALKDFQAAAALAPTNAEPFAYSGWIIRLQGYPDEALQLIDKAIEVDPSYPDAHFFRGFILLQDQKNPKAAIPEFQQYLVAAPDSALADQVRSLLAQAVKAAK